MVFIVVQARFGAKVLKSWYGCVVTTHHFLPQAQELKMECHFLHLPGVLRMRRLYFKGVCLKWRVLHSKHSLKAEQKEELEKEIKNLE